MAKLSEIEGIGPASTEKLAGCGIKNQAQLLEACGRPAGRKKIAAESGISPKLILNWTNRADLARVKGIGEEYADLLEASGVDSVPELAQRKPENLHAKMTEANEAKKLVRSLPALGHVEKWVAAAKEMPRAVHH
ncbi:hypothetical protein SADO_15109 [Salinisphaera dokdonensis CL-ES53]|uniref:DUF4332 domain-containing protein n=1 Tax=Salinisphaera dokdonensis CL-ES53 TaxID=1304272 RepID=A0ABV2B3X3_9GAMM